jgi:hypothetical protein
MKYCGPPMSTTSESRLYQWPQHDELSAICDVLGAIPDGIHLAFFPSHSEGADCWCRPHVDVASGEILVHHKNFAEGGFDS